MIWMEDHNPPFGGLLLSRNLRENEIEIPILCDKEFIVALTLPEGQRGAVVQCPGCNSKNVRQMISPFIAKTASKTA